MSSFKEQVGKLVKAVCEKAEPEDVNDTVEFITERLNHFTDYFNVVHNDVVSGEVNRSLFAMGRIDGEELKSRIMAKDNERRAAHEVAIASCAQLNRQCEMYGCEKFCPETTDRHEIAEFIGTYIQEIYQDGITPKERTSFTLDEAIENAKMRARKPEKAYDGKQPEEVREWAR